MRRRADIDRNVSGVVRSVHEDFRVGDRTGQVDRFSGTHDKWTARQSGSDCLVCRLGTRNVTCESSL